MEKKFTENQISFMKLMYEARKESGLTQNQVARLLHKNQSYISKYENGERRLDVLEFLELAHVMGFNPSEFITKLNRVWKKK